MRQAPIVSIHAPAQGATFVEVRHSNHIVFQSTPPHRERLRGQLRRIAVRSFNPRPRTGSDPIRISIVSLDISFQSTPPHRERLASSAAAPPSLPFQSTPPHRERRNAPSYHLGRTRFQSTPPHRERRSFPAPRRCSGSFNPRPRTGSDSHRRGGPRSPISFNPRPRTGSDEIRRAFGTGGSVSIHAPAQGATEKLDKVIELLGFQSTPPHRERLKPICGKLFYFKFQSTPPHRERHHKFVIKSWAERVSIHAPAQGAT